MDNDDQKAARAKRAARIRTREGVLKEECLAELGYEAACDCHICDTAYDQ